ncbi:hypothetical protein [Calothrix sp. NIES-3974]|uniref:hypothetical protein n=1 Tax=Calothrix sp. NIES-3974 TaxID=2005462 RepID=UPI000BBB7AD7|nr:hypothetical protein [Calothrix sp. NIES-3974]
MGAREIRFCTHAEHGAREKVGDGCEGDSAPTQSMVRGERSAMGAREKVSVFTHKPLIEDGK